MFSSFLYLEHFGITIKTLNTFTALTSLALLLYAPKKAILTFGFLVGLLWFYWISYSFKYYEVGYIAPLVVIGFGFIYMAFFGILALTKEIYIRAILIFGLSFFEPLDFNWMQIELLFVESYIGVFKHQLALVLIALTLPNYLNKPFRFAPLLLIVFALNYTSTKSEDAPLKIKIESTNIKQADKWEQENLKPTVKLIYAKISDAIKNGYDIVVFPESVFPLYMNKNPLLVEELLRASRKITIIAGSLEHIDFKSYNVTYVFNDGKYLVAKKMVLVPFGEYIPLPEFMRDFINDTFFGGASDFKTADAPTDYTIKGVTFRNAICYEATCSEIYDGDVKYVIAMSNNAWFEPSIEPTLQNLLLRFYARKNSVTIYHSANYKGSGIIK